MFQRQGNYPVPPGASDLPGLEVAGEIVDGDLAGSGFAKGDMVCALVQGGGYAEYCAAPLAQCLPVPKGLSMIEAASLPETFYTVWTNVFDRAQLSEGETLLVQGGTSGIGVTAIQLATAMGHRVFATAGSADKCRACEELGAERGINYRDEDFVAVVKELDRRQGRRRGARHGRRRLRGARDRMPGGRRAHRDHRVAGRGESDVDLGQVLRRRLTISGSTLRPRPVAFKGAIARKLRERVWPLLEAGTHQAGDLQGVSAGARRPRRTR